MEAFYGINPENGRIVWTYDYIDIDSAKWGEQGAVINCTSPTFHDGELYVTSGYNHTGAKFKIKDGDGTHWAHPTINDGKLYIRHGNVLLRYNIKA